MVRVAADHDAVPARRHESLSIGRSDRAVVAAGVNAGHIVIGDSVAEQTFSDHRVSQIRDGFGRDSPHTGGYVLPYRSTRSSPRRDLISAQRSWLPWTVRTPWRRGSRRAQASESLSVPFFRERHRCRGSRRGPAVRVKEIAGSRRRAHRFRRGHRRLCLLAVE